MVVRRFIGLDIYYFEGSYCIFVFDFEEDLIEEVDVFLVKKYRFRIEDINFEVEDRYIRCFEFYFIIRGDLGRLDMGVIKF